jgi:AcrR family transcriptional regulator
VLLTVAAAHFDTRVAYFVRIIYATLVAKRRHSQMTEIASRRGRPRDDAVDHRVLDAAWQVLHTEGYAALTVDEVAKRAGTAKTTVYRRWPTKDHLAVAVAERILGDVPIAETDDLRRDLTEFVAALAESLSRLRRAGHPDGGPSAGLAAELVGAFARQPDIGALVRAEFAARHALARARLRRAREAEGLRTDLDDEVLIDQLAGPLYYRVLITGMPVDRSYASRLVSTVLDGAFMPKE